MCEICMDVLNEPLLTTCCGQSYCRECVNQLRQNTCPHCRDPLNTIEDKKSSRILSNTKIKCPYHLFNKCKWNGNTSDLKSHLTTCQFKPVTCAKKCGVSRERKNIDRHLKTECDLRSQYCQYCSKEVVHKEMSGHVAECPIFPLDCPNGCSQSKILRQDMKKHIEKCPLEIVSCEFAKFGCNVKPKRQELSNHNTSNMGDHVVLLARAIAIKDEKINQLENKVITLETKLKNKRII
ncbi:TNF receptor-associated factor 5-like [Dysidea avara]|uniref:TNF receptor-associated factor 5-like n=1 Tax=Dysidea avara TaxID=196820 RepID=UPI003331B1D5